jgi:hypothetical protein
MRVSKGYRPCIYEVIINDKDFDQNKTKIQEKNFNHDFKNRLVWSN